MKTREQREKELLSDGLVDAIKQQFAGKNCIIPEKYYILIADYIDSLSQVENDLHVDPVMIAKMIPDVLKEIRDENLQGIHGITDNKTIRMNNNMDYETNKLYFFHELTHAIQTRMINDKEICAFSDGKTGMFLTEGATQFTAEILYHISNGTNLQYRNQPGTVRGHSEHTPYSALSEYQLNGNILMLLSASLGLELKDLLAMAYRSDGRQMLMEMYEVFPENSGKFEEFMFDLEKIYSIDKCLIAGYGNQLSGGPVNIEMNGGQQFQGNLESQGQLINKVERELAANFIGFNDNEYIMKHWELVYNSLTNAQLKKDFLAAVNEVALMQNTTQSVNTSSRR